MRLFCTTGGLLSFCSGWRQTVPITPFCESKTANAENGNSLPWFIHKAATNFNFALQDA
jgi:hypothetical protein